MIHDAAHDPERAAHVIDKLLLQDAKPQKRMDRRLNGSRTRNRDRFCTVEKHEVRLEEIADWPAVEGSVGQFCPAGGHRRKRCADVEPNSTCHLIRR